MYFAVRYFVYVRPPLVHPRAAPWPLQFQSEVRAQIRRLGSHPSIAIWGGNNEVEASFDW